MVEGPPILNRLARDKARDAWDPMELQALHCDPSGGQTPILAILLFGEGLSVIMALINLLAGPGRFTAELRQAIKFCDALRRPGGMSFKRLVLGRSARQIGGGPSLVDHVGPGIDVHSNEIFGPVLDNRAWL